MNGFSSLRYYRKVLIYRIRLYLSTWKRPRTARAVVPERGSRGMGVPPEPRRVSLPADVAPLQVVRSTDPAPNRGDEMDFFTDRDLLEVVRKRWGVIAGVFAASMAATAGVTFLQTPLYEAESVLLVKFGREFIYRAQVGDESIINRDQQALINAELQILRSNDLISSVVAKVGPDKLYADLGVEPATSPLAVQAAARRFAADYRAEALPNANVLRVTFRHAEPATTVEALDLLVEGFKEKHLEAFGDAQGLTFLTEKVEEFRTRLSEAEDAIKRFQSENRQFLDEGEVLLRQKHELEGTLKGIENQIAGLREKLNYLQKERANATTGEAAAVSTERNPTIVQAKANLLELQLEEQKLLANFSESNRQVVNIRKQIELVKKFLAEQEAVAEKSGAQSGLEVQIIDTVAELRFQEAKASSVRQQLGVLNAQVVDLPQVDARYRELARDRDSAEKNLSTYSRRLEESRASAEMDQQKIANISVIQEPIMPLSPAYPKKKLNLAIGAVVGVVLGFACAFLFRGKAKAFDATVASRPLDRDGETAALRR